MRSHESRLTALAVLLAALACTHAWGTVETLPVALSGDPAPGAPGRTFAGFHRVTIDDAGQVMFGAQLDASDATNNEGIWFGAPGALTLLLRKGDPAPGVPGRTISRFFISGTNRYLQHQWHPQHNNTGQVVVVAYLDGADPSEEAAIWKGEPGNLQPIALSGDPAPGATGRTFKWFVNPLIDDAGNVLFYAVLDNYDTGLWYHGDAGLVPIVVEGAPVPGAPGISYTGIATHTFDLAPTGEIAFIAGVPYPVNWVLVSGTPDALELAYSGEMPAPGAPATTLSFGGSPSIAAGGTLAFYGAFADRSLRNGIFHGRPGDLRLFARSGDPVPGTAGEVYFDAGFQPAINALGQVVFRGGLSDVSYLRDDVLVAGSPGAWAPIVRTGETAPGSGGQLFDRPGSPAFFAPALNESGIVAFEAYLRDLSRTGLWVWHEGELEAVAAGGTPLPVGPGDDRPVWRISFVDPHGGYGWGGMTGLNDRDEVAYDVAFDDGSRGVFVSGVMTVTNQPPRCDEAQASVAELWPPSHEFTAATILGVFDPDGDEVELRIDAVTSDEPASGPGNPHSPDAFVEGSDTVQLRAERLGEGNGRVYEIRFTASDGIDSCDGSVRVVVPHDRSGDGAIDDGQDYEATGS